MEEADVLCNRIGIVNKGVLRCIGTQNRLKTIYGGGYHLYINCYNQKFLKAKFSGEELNERAVQEELDAFIKRLLPKAIKLR
jgi:ABC-type multidrug transport system ATPase subunit